MNLVRLPCPDIIEGLVDPQQMVISRWMAGWWFPRIQLDQRNESTWSHGIWSTSTSIESLQCSGDAFIHCILWSKLPLFHLLYSPELNSIKCPVLYYYGSLVAAPCSTWSSRRRPSVHNRQLVYGHVIRDWVYSWISSRGLFPREN